MKISTWVIIILLLVIIISHEEPKNGARDVIPFLNSPSNYIVIKSIGNRVTDIWKLENTIVYDLNGNKWVFKYYGTIVTISGECIIIRLSSDNPIWESYEEFHELEIHKTKMETK